MNTIKHKQTTEERLQEWFRNNGISKVTLDDTGLLTFRSGMHHLTVAAEGDEAAHLVFAIETVTRETL